MQIYLKGGLTIISHSLRSICDEDPSLFIAVFWEFLADPEEAPTHVNLKMLPLREGIGWMWTIVPLRIDTESVIL